MRAKREAAQVAKAMRQLEEDASDSSGSASDTDSDNGKKSSRKRGDQAVRQRFLKAVRRDPRLLLGKTRKFKVCGVSLSHMTLCTSTFY